MELKDNGIKDMTSLTMSGSTLKKAKARKFDPRSQYIMIADAFHQDNLVLFAENEENTLSGIMAERVYRISKGKVHNKFIPTKTYVVVSDSGFMLKISDTQRIVFEVGVKYRYKGDIVNLAAVKSKGDVHLDENSKENKDEMKELISSEVAKFLENKISSKAMTSENAMKNRDDDVLKQSEAMTIANSTKSKPTKKKK